MHFATTLFSENRRDLIQRKISSPNKNHADNNFAAKRNIFSDLLHAEFGKEFPSRTLWRGLPFALQNRALVERKERAKKCREEWMQRGDKQRLGKRKRAREKQVSFPPKKSNFPWASQDSIKHRHGLACFPAEACTFLNFATVILDSGRDRSTVL